MLQKQKILAFSCLIIFLFSLSACRTKVGDSTDTNTNSTANNQNTTEKKELVIWNLFDNTDSLKGQIQAFKSAHPGVQITYKKFVNLDEYWETVLNELAEGEGPDIFAINNNWVHKHYKKFYPMPLEGLEIPMNPEIYRQTFFNVASQDLIIDNYIFGIPLFIDTLAIFYNKQLFIDNISNSDEPGKTWDTIKEQVYTLTKPDRSPERFAVAGIAMGRADNIIRANDILYALMLEHGTQFYNDEESQAIFNNQQGSAEGTGKQYYPGQASLELYSSFGIPSYKNYSWNNSITGRAPSAKEINPFVRGKIGMIFGYSYLYQQLLDAISGQTKTGGKHINKDDIGIAPLPQLYDYQDTGKQDAFADYYPLVVSRNTTHPILAWNLLLYLSSADSLQTYHEKTNKPTSRKDMVDNQSTEPLWGVFARQASYAKSFKLFDKPRFNQYFNEAIQSVVNNKKTVQEALGLSQKRINCLLDKNFKKDSNQDINCDTIL